MTMFFPLAALVCGLPIVLVGGLAFLIGVKGLFIYWRATRRDGFDAAVVRIRQKPTFVPLAAVSPNLLFAILFAEDCWFFRHRGLRLRGIYRAVKYNLRVRRVAVGGSTLTQQLAKNLFFTFDRRLSRKVAEVLAVRRLEKRFTKDELLELYVNAVSYGCVPDGIAEACQTYFSCAPQSLTLGQSLMLAAMLPAPKRFHPVQNPAEAMLRQQTLVLRMFRDGHLDLEDGKTLFSTGALGGRETEARYTAQCAAFLDKIRGKQLPFPAPDPKRRAALQDPSSTLFPRHTADGLVKFARMCLALQTRYMLGGMGQVITLNLIRRQRAQFPEHYTDQRTAYLQTLAGKGYRGFDCSGLVKSYYFNGIHNLSIDPDRDKSSDAMWSEATVKGPINTLPDVPGLCVYLPGHIGIYVGAGQVIECTLNPEFGDGVVNSPLAERPWTHWLQCPPVDYG